MPLMALLYAATALVGVPSFRLYAESLSYPQRAVVFIGASLLISNFGLSKIIEFSALALYFLYPLAIALILLGLFGHFSTTPIRSASGPCGLSWPRQSWSCAGWWGSGPRRTLRGGSSRSTPMGLAG